MYQEQVRTILRATSTMITDTDNDQLNYWKILAKIVWMKQPESEKKVKQMPELWNKTYLG